MNLTDYIELLKRIVKACTSGKEFANGARRISERKEEKLKNYYYEEITNIPGLQQSTVHTK